MDDDQKVFYPEAIKAIKDAILHSRYLAARLANAELLKLYFSIGGYVSANTRLGKWGKGAIEAISRSLQTELPGLRGFSPTNIKNMRIFYEYWAAVLIRQLPTDELDVPVNQPSSDNDVIETSSLLEESPMEAGTPFHEDLKAFLSIGFTHHMEIIYKAQTPEERWYYIRQCASCFWNVETLRRHLAAEDHEHTGTLVNNFALTMPDKKQVARAVRSFKDEYLLDFINIEDVADEGDVDERVLEHSLVKEIKQFIQSLGPDFCFIANQQRILVAEEEFFIDLLFYHRGLRCLVAIELKRGKFKPAYLGQLNFYLSTLDKQVKHPDENQSIGLLLCQEANRTIVELAVQDFNKPIGVATYRLGSEIPEPYRVLIPMLDGVQRIISENGTPG